MLGLTAPRTVCALLGLLLLLLTVDGSSSSSSSGVRGSLYGREDAGGGAGGSRPHLVFLFCDNVGWANVGFHRSTPTPEVVTPNIDELVRWICQHVSGRRLRSFMYGV